MSYYIVWSTKGYLTPRRKTDTLYELRSGWSKNPNDARIYNTKPAAKNSANRMRGIKKYRVIPVEIDPIFELAEECEI